MGAQSTSKPWLNATIKLVIAIAFLVVIVYELMYHRDLASLWENFLTSLSAKTIWMVILVLLLAPLNWAMETLIWARLMAPVYRMPFWQAFKGVFGGMSLSLFTPNRIGEYGGRILFVPSRYNWYAVVSTMTGNFALNLVIVFAGLLAGAIYLQQEQPWPLAVIRGTQLLIGLLLVIALLLYYRLPDLANWLKQVEVPKWLRKPHRAVQLLGRVTKNDLRMAMWLSVFKYLIFTSQFVLLLVFFRVDVPIHLLFLGVAILYLLQTGVPLPPFFEVVLRAEVAILVWTDYNANELSVYAASLFIWILNLVIPSFFGLAAISTVNVLKSLGYDQEKAGPGHAVDADDHGDHTVPGTPV